MTQGSNPLNDRWGISDILDNDHLGIVTDTGPFGDSLIVVSSYNNIHEEVLRKIVEDHNAQLAAAPKAGKGDV